MIAEQTAEGIGLQVAEASTLAPDESKAEGSGLALRVALGATYQQLYSVPVVSMASEIGVGSSSDAFAYYFAGWYQVGRSEFGLSVQSVHAGALTEWRVLHFRFGAGFGIGNLWVVRATMPDDSLSSWSVGVRPFVAFDLTHRRRADSLYVELASRIDYYAPWVIAPTVSVGYSWR